MLLTMVTSTGEMWAADETITFSDLGLTSGTQYTTISGTDCTLTFGDGGNDGKYYTTGAAIRVYADGHMTVSSTTKTIEKVELTFGTGDGSNTITTDVETYSNGTWTGAATSSVTFSVGGTSGHRRIASVAITYSSGGDPCTITLISNGMTTIVNATQGSVYKFPKPNNVPSGYAYRGWSTKNEGITAGDVKSSFTPDASTAIYYAAYTTVTYTYEEVTSLNNIVDGEYVITAISGTTPYTLKNALAAAGKVNAYKLEDLSLTISSTTLSGDVSDVIWTFSGDNTNGFTVTSGNNYLYATNTNNGMCVGGTSDKWKFSNTSKSKTFYMQDTNQSRYLALYVSTPNWRCYSNTSNGVPSLTLYKQTPDYGSSYVATIADPSIPGNVSVATATEISTSQTFEGNLTITAPLTISGTAVVAVEGNITNANVSNLVIGNGAQLKLADANTGVKATVKKSVKTWTGSKDDPVNDGWQTISTSTHDDGEDFVSFSNVDNLVYLVSTTPKYNVYYYDEENIQWINNLATPTYSTLNVGQGYIYRTGGSTDLEYKGYVNTGDIDVDLSYNSGTASFKGFNLIGNPYTHSIYKGGEGSAIDNGSLLEAKYYALNLTTGTFDLTNDGTEIPRGTAIMVQAKSAGTLTMVNTSDYVAPAKSGNDNIWFTVKNENFQDFACVDFKPGRGLNKIDHQNENAPMLYINHNGENFGSVNMSDDAKSINLNFKAKTTGKYTLILKPEGNFNYIHVIDKLTGEDVDMLLEGEYSFIASPMDADNRFVVRLGYQPDYGIDEYIFAYQSGNDIYVTGNGELHIFDVTGRRVLTTTINGSESISIPAQGVYIFRLNEKVQKIVVR